MFRVTLGEMPPRRHDDCLMAHLRSEPFESILYANRAGASITVPVDGLLYINDSPHEPGEVVPIAQGDRVVWCPGYAS
jgi:hypothetical protein